MMAATLSNTELRNSARLAGFFLNYDQLDAYREWGLLPEPDATGRWPAETVERLHHIHMLQGGMRSLARRVLWLRFNDPLFRDIPAEKVRTAMIEILPTISAGEWKMRFVHRERPVRQRTDPWKPVPRSRWDTMLVTIPDDMLPALIEEWSEEAKHLPEPVSADVGNGTKKVVAIPFEERFTLMAIHDMGLLEEVLQALGQAAERFAKEMNKVIQTLMPVVGMLTVVQPVLKEIVSTLQNPEMQGRGLDALRSVLEQKSESDQQQAAKGGSRDNVAAATVIYSSGDWPYRRAVEQPDPTLVETEPFITELGAERIITELGEDATVMPAAGAPLPRQRAAKTKRPA